MTVRMDSTVNKQHLQHRIIVISACDLCICMLEDEVAGEACCARCTKDTITSEIKKETAAK